MADVFAHKSARSTSIRWPRLKTPHGPEYFSHYPATVVLPVPGVALEYHVQDERFGNEPLF
jgi:hypothetical protein